MYIVRENLKHIHGKFKKNKKINKFFLSISSSN